MGCGGASPPFPVDPGLWGGRDLECGALSVLGVGVFVAFVGAFPLALAFVSGFPGGELSVWVVLPFAGVLLGRFAELCFFYYV